MGGFWKSSNDLVVHGLDKNPARAPHVVADFTHLPFKDAAYDLVVFDPPYVSNMGKGKPSIMGGQFGNFDTLTSLESAITQGAREAFRVARIGVLVKVQDHIRAGKLVRLSRWVEDAIPVPLYDEMHVQQRHKLIDPKWGDQLSLYRNHSTYMVFRKGSQQHKRRTRDTDE